MLSLVNLVKHVNCDGCLPVQLQMCEMPCCALMASWEACLVGVYCLYIIGCCGWLWLGFSNL